MSNAVLPISDIQGADGYSPTITVKTDTSTNYVLTITDVNGSYNILRKAIPNVFIEGIEGLGVNPSIIKILKK